MLKILGVNEVESILTERGDIEVNCDFCNKHYVFDAVDAAEIFNEKAVLIETDSENKTAH